MTEPVRPVTPPPAAAPAPPTPPPGPTAAAAAEPPPPPPPHPIVARVREQFGDALLREEQVRGQLILYVEPGKIIEVATFLRDEISLKFDHLADVTAVDYLAYNPEGGPPGEGRIPRFDVVYNFYSIPLNHRVRVKAALDEDNPHIDSVVGVYPSANWAERETYDLYGIVFDGHPNMTRILTPEDFQGHPLRKDYPLIEEEIEFSGTLASLNEMPRPVHERARRANG